MPEIEMVTVEEPPKPRELYHIASRVLDIPRMERVYKLQRAVVNLKAPLAAPLYHMTDMELTRFGRKVRARLYTPGKEDGGCLILFFHGGGWVTESVDSYHGGLRETGRRAGGEGHLGRVWAGAGTPVPGGAGGLFRRGGGRFSRNPAVSATAPEDIVLMGDSAGGNLAAAVSLMGRDREMFTVPAAGPPLPRHLQRPFPRDLPLPVYPGERGRGISSPPSGSASTGELYLSPDDWYDPYAAPLLEKNLSRQPDTLVITAGLDPLRDEGEGLRPAAAGGRKLGRGLPDGRGAPRVYLPCPVAGVCAGL